MCTARVRTNEQASEQAGFSAWLQREESRFGRLHAIHPVITESILCWTREVLLASGDEADFFEIESVVARLFAREGIVVFHLRACVSAALEYCAIELGLTNFGLRGRRNELVDWLLTAELYRSVPRRRIETAVTCLLDELDLLFYRGGEFDEALFPCRLHARGICAADETWACWLAGDAMAYLDGEGFLQHTGH